MLEITLITCQYLFIEIHCTKMNLSSHNKRHGICNAYKINGTPICSLLMESAFLSLSLVLSSSLSVFQPSFLSSHFFSCGIKGTIATLNCWIRLVRPADFLFRGNHPRPACLSRLKGAGEVLRCWGERERESN